MVSNGHVPTSSAVGRRALPPPQPGAREINPSSVAVSYTHLTLPTILRV